MKIKQDFLVKNLKNGKQKIILEVVSYLEEVKKAQMYSMWHQMISLMV